MAAFKGRSITPWFRGPFARPNSPNDAESGRKRENFGCTREKGHASLRRILPYSFLGGETVVKKAFTLIELLIVVAIIAILAAIAVPNFLEAQTRAKVSRIKSDHRSLATAIESYAVDNTRYPRELNSSWYAGDTIGNPGVTGSGVIWWGLSTPIAYMTTVYFIDTFQDKNLNAALDEQYFTYQDMRKRAEDNPSSTFWPPARGFYGDWRLGSVGPDKLFAHGFTNSAQMAYDPTNGTVSLGNIWRSQNNPDNKQPNPPLVGAH